MQGHPPGLIPLKNALCPNHWTNAPHAMVVPDRLGPPIVCSPSCTPLPPVKVKAYVNFAIICMSSESDVQFWIVLAVWACLLQLCIDWHKSDSFLLDTWAKTCLEAQSPYLPGGLSWCHDAFKALGIFLGPLAYLGKNWEGLSEEVEVHNYSCGTGVCSALPTLAGFSSTMWQLWARVTPWKVWGLGVGGFSLCWHSGFLFPASVLCSASRKDSTFLNFHLLVFNIFTIKTFLFFFLF